MIHDPIPEHHGGAFAEAFAAPLARAASVLDPALADTARRALVTQLARRWIGCTITAFLADGHAPTSEPTWAAFLARYPVCARLIRESELAWRYDCDRLLAAIARAFPGAQLVALEHDAGFLGSRRSAHVLRFADHRRAVYRPYALPAGPWFMDVCATIDPALDTPLHVRTITSEGDTTWDEHVVAAPCTEPDGIARYFHRAGMLARLLEAVRAADMHMRNVLLVGEHPVILDLEGILAWRDEPSPTAAGFLPVSTRGPAGERIDLGGLHPGGDVTLPVQQPHLRNGRFEHDYPTKHVTPTVPAPIAAHVDDLLAGYRELDAALGRVSLDAHVAHAATLRTRMFGRSGLAYRALLFASIAPPLLRDEAAREAFILANAAPLERSSLRALRAPRFVGTPPVPDFRPHAPNALARAEAQIRAATTGSAG